MKRMLQHENPHTTILNSNLWAVHFSLIPMIPQISWKPDPEIPAERIPSEITPDGIMVLNKDFKYFDLVKKASLAAMGLKKPRKIRLELDRLKREHMAEPLHTVYRYCLIAELERRKAKKVGGA